jgi:Asp/Glu/hydantoin racemase
VTDDGAAESPLLGLVYPFPRDTGGRLERHQEFWAEVGRHVASLGRPVLEAWPEAGGVPLRPEVSDPAYGAGDILPPLRKLAGRCSALAICDMYEPGLAEARAELAVPVHGALQACLAMTRDRPARLGFVTARPGVSEAFLRLRLAAYGVEPHTVHALSAWSYDLLLDSTTGRNDAMLDDLLGRAEACVKDGAEMIVPVCVFFGPMLALSGSLEVAGVAIVDPLAALVDASFQARRHDRP